MLVMKEVIASILIINIIGLIQLTQSEERILSGDNVLDFKPNELKII